MHAKRITGTKARTSTDAPTPDKSDATRCECGAPAAGLDALTHEPTCADCATDRFPDADTVYQARCRTCGRTWEAHRLRSAAEGDASIHNGIVHEGLELAEVEDVQP
ncbi:hypothetical protein [Salarchaeum japonicum]|uniref:Small CPxCG-related zinc finger protein n=1 Tax=Salarchaeum japonicum TaxID=555573 RepID=A0AAV3T0D8_9EURY|nr:hypothetical protein [Salarchaeum japonicum]